MSENIQEVNETNFKTVVLDSKYTGAGGLLGSLCMPCRAQQPILKRWPTDYRVRR